MRIVFMGTPDFAVPSLQAVWTAGYEITAVVTQPDRPKGRGQRLTPPPVKEAALKLGLPVLQPEKIKTSEFAGVLRGLQPDLIVAAAFGQLLSKEILDIPRFGCINVHASLLPKYRGAAPIHRAVMNGEKETGVTIMQMAEGLDTGDMLMAARIGIEPEDSTGTIHDKLAEAGAALLVQAVAAIAQGQITGTPQDHGQATYASPLTKETEKIDWTGSSADIFNQVRGLNPRPGAYTLLGDKVLKIWQTRACTIDRLPGPIPELADKRPGEILGRIPEVGFAVTTGNGCLAVAEVQLQGSKRMRAEDFMNGHQIKAGTVLG